MNLKKLDYIYGREHDCAILVWLAIKQDAKKYVGYTLNFCKLKPELKIEFLEYWIEDLNFHLDIIKKRKQKRLAKKNKELVT